MSIHPSITLDRVVEAVEADDYYGFCLACGTEVQGVEPDARSYKCDDCGERRVFGAEELLIILQD